ncbi:MAG TPA: NAD(P)H-binding protein [Pseudonocardiaceae bacterium]|nr:NAD(P)H-binding protein [Pseudonocardiaceae bacterium]
MTVTGATGKTGTHVARLGTERGWRVRGAGRRPPPHGEWVPFSWDDETTWKPAFDGSQAAYAVIPFNSPGAPARAPAVIEAAAAAGVGRIVLLSTIDVDHAPPADPTRIAEQTLARLPVESAMLRPTWFLDNFTTGSFAAMTATGELRLPAGDGRIPFVDVRDIAEVAIAAMAPGGPTGPLPITGPRAVDHHEVAAALATALGRQVTYTPVPPAEFVELMAARGFSTEYGWFLAGALGAVADGSFDVPVAGTVRRLTGRDPYGPAEFAAYYAKGLPAGG